MWGDKSQRCEDNTTTELPKLKSVAVRFLLSDVIIDVIIIIIINRLHKTGEEFKNEIIRLREQKKDQKMQVG